MRGSTKRRHRRRQFLQAIEEAEARETVRTVHVQVRVDRK